jgi:hypothetical protein
MMDTTSRVTHDENLVDRLGNVRQFDVVIRGSFGGRPMLGVIEAKDHKRRKGPSDVEAFAKKSEHLGANLRIMVSRRGFTPQALRVAKHEFITCLSLLPSDTKQGFLIGQFCYGLIRRWTDVRMLLRFRTRVYLKDWSYENLKYDNKNVVNWFLYELFVTHSRDRPPGTYCLALEFPEGLSIELNGIEYQVSELSCMGTLVEVAKRKWFSWTGDAFFNWANSSIEAPGGTQLVGTAIETDLTLWDDYDGEIPTEPAPRGFLMLAFGGQSPPASDEIPDLMKANPNRTIGPVEECASLSNIRPISSQPRLLGILSGCQSIAALSVTAQGQESTS